MKFDDFLLRMTQQNTSDAVVAVIV